VSDAVGRGVVRRVQMPPDPVVRGGSMFRFVEDDRPHDCTSADGGNGVFCVACCPCDDCTFTRRFGDD
jgi:hypothetical protein